MANLAEIAVSPEALAGVIAGGSDKPVVVDFWAPWCGTCRLMAPAILRLSRERSQDVTVVSLNIEDGQEIAVSHGVMSLPTLLIFRGGKEVKRLNGMKSYDNLVAEISAVTN